jgi:hypothetical protein
MKRTILALAGAALLASPAWAHADQGSAASAFVPSAFALPIVGMDVSNGSPAVTLEAVRYRPRERYYRPADRGPQNGSLTQLHLGFYDPEGNADNGFVMGMRGGPLVDPHIQVGAMADWVHRSDNQSTVLGSTPGPGGTTIETRRELARSSSNLFPVMGFLQVQADENLPFIPYFGVGGGYEVLFLSAEDFNTGNSFDATYGGWGWQAWGGAAVPLSGRSRLTGEIFVNQAEAHRDVDDPTTGETVREIVTLNGVGMRFGLNWGF